MTIEFLHEAPQYVAPAAALMRSLLSGPPCLEPYLDVLSHSLTPGRLPLAAVAVEDGEVIGAVGIFIADLLSRQDLRPWLACLAVRKDRQGKGVGTALQAFALDCCRLLGYETVYLYTTLDGYYERTGWRYLCSGCEEDGSAVKIYSHAL